MSASVHELQLECIRGVLFNDRADLTSHKAVFRHIFGQGNNIILFDAMPHGTIVPLKYVTSDEVRKFLLRTDNPGTPDGDNFCETHYRNVHYVALAIGIFLTQAYLLGASSIQ